jgi:hypothetical protein
MRDDLSKEPLHAGHLTPKTCLMQSLSLARFALQVSHARVSAPVQHRGAEVSDANEHGEKSGGQPRHSSQAMWIHSSCRKLAVRRHGSRLSTTIIHGEKTKLFLTRGSSDILLDACKVVHGIKDPTVDRIFVRPMVHVAYTSESSSRTMPLYILGAPKLNGLVIQDEA